MNVSQLIKIIIKKNTLLFVSITFLLLVGGVIETVSLLFVAPIVDIITSESVSESSHVTQNIFEIISSLGLPTSLWFMLLIYIFIISVSAIFATAVLYVVLRIKYSYLGNLIYQTTDEIFKARWTFFSNMQQGKLINTLSREFSIVGDTLASLGRLCSTIIQVIVFLAIPFYISWKTMSMTFGVVLLIYTPLLLLGRYSSKLGALNTKANNEYLIVIQESLSLAKVILGLSTQEKTVNRINSKYHQNIKAAIKAAVFDNVLTNSYKPLGAIGLTVLIIISQIIGVPVSETAILAVAFVRVSGKFGQIINEKNLLDRSLPSMDQVNDIRVKAKELKQTSGTIEFSELKESIEIKDLSFAYPGHSTILKKISLTIPKGKMIAIVGESGAGKSTIIDVIIGFNEPSSGSISIDGVPLHKYKINSYRKRIGYIPQESILFNMSITENIRWANDEATIDDIKKACQDANANEFIESFRDQYNTIVGDRGTRLSGGQLQRVALARAIIRKPDILILDEATSALDTKTEKKIQQAIERITQETTTIVIAHRLSTIVNAAHIYILDKGIIVEHGDYQSLLKKNGVLTRIIKDQEFTSMD